MNSLLMDRLYSHYIYLSTYLKMMNVYATGRPNAHDINLFDIIQGPSLWRDYALRPWGFICVWSWTANLVLCVNEKLNKLFSFFVKVLKFESQVSFLTLLQAIADTWIPKENCSTQSFKSKSSFVLLIGFLVICIKI